MIHTQDADFTLLQGDVLDCLRDLPDESVHCVVTSPPYWGLRDYGTEGQLGLEPTPDEYVRRMVEVFREVRRVLRSDGTCWVNLGDSYASGETGRMDAATKNLLLAETQKPRAERRITQRSGTKPKDLVGIPWLVARALREPYYTGSIPKERDRVWLAATIDGEGSICGFLHERKDDGRIRTGVHVTITNTSRALLDEAQRIWPTSREDHNPHGEGHRGSLPIWRWIAHGAESRAALMRELYPYLIVKRTQALLAYNLLRFQMDGKRLGRSAVGDEVRAKRELLTRLLSDANAQRPVDVPSWCDEPPSLYEPGWYLRSDIIWSKPNPMPESVTDRPTKAHEYVFLLAKSPRYFFDQEAVREPHESTRWGGRYHTQNPNGKYTPDSDVRIAAASKARADRPDFDHYPHSGRNVRSVWEIATQPYPEAHFATYPEELVRRCILAGTSERGCCPVCGKPWEREVEREQTKAGEDYASRMERAGDDFTPLHQPNRAGAQVPIRYNLSQSRATTLGWRPGCDCEASGDIGIRALAEEETLDGFLAAHAPIPCTVLDPFLGSGTTAYVARKHGRRSIGIELNADYCELATKRMQQQSLFA